MSRKFSWYVLRDGLPIRHDVNDLTDMHDDRPGLKKVSIHLQVSRYRSRHKLDPKCK